MRPKDRPSGETIMSLSRLDCSTGAACACHCTLSMQCHEVCNIAVAHSSSSCNLIIIACHRLLHAYRSCSVPTIEAELLHRALSGICCTAAELFHGMAWHDIATAVSWLPRRSHVQCRGLLQWYFSRSELVSTFLQVSFFLQHPPLVHCSAAATLPEQV